MWLKKIKKIKKASCMNSGSQQCDLTVPHAGSDPLRQVRFTAGAYCI